jgi:hypothetical protein
MNTRAATTERQRVACFSIPQAINRQDPAAHGSDQWLLVCENWYTYENPSETARKHSAFGTHAPFTSPDHCPPDACSSIGEFVAGTG